MLKNFENEKDHTVKLLWATLRQKILHKIENLQINQFYEDILKFIPPKPSEEIGIKSDILFRSKRNKTIYYNPMSAKDWGI